MHELHQLSSKPPYIGDRTLSLFHPAQQLRSPLMSLSFAVTSHLPADCLTSIVGTQPQCFSQHRHMGPLMQKTPSHGERPSSKVLEKRNNKMKIPIPPFELATEILH